MRTSISIISRKRARGFTSAMAIFVLLAFASVSHATLLTNGGFETGNFTGWTNSDANWITIVYGGTDIGYAAALGGFGGSLSQSFNTNPGEEYGVSYRLYNTGGPQSLFQTVVNGNVLLEQTNLPYQLYTEYNLKFTANSLTTTLLFNERSSIYYPGNFLLDDVSVDPVPEPATMLLLGGGIMGLMGFGWLRKKIAG